jgi:hypothetical protein
MAVLWNRRPPRMHPGCADPLFKKKEERPPFFGLHASQNVVSLRLCPQVPLIGMAYSAPQLVAYQFQHIV